MPESAKPPFFGTFILSLFSAEPDFPEIEGDLSEEFHDRVRSAGSTSARRWYLREAFRNVSALTLRQFTRSPIRTLAAMSIACLVVLNLPPFLVLFEIHHRRFPNLEWSTWNVFCVAYFSLMPLLLGVLSSRLLPDRTFALAITLTGLHLLGGTLRLLNCFYLEPFVQHPADLDWWWTVVGFSVASLATRNRRRASSSAAA